MTPIDGFNAFLDEEFVGFGKMLAPKKSPMSRERRWMRPTENVMTRSLLVNNASLLLSVGPPKHKNQSRRTRFAQTLYDGVRKCLPSFVFVAISFGFSDSETGVEQQDSLLGPTAQIAVSWSHKTLDIGFQFFVHVDQRRRWWHAFLHAEAKAVGLIGSVVGVLAENDDFNLVNGTSARP